jgi:NIPSNAP
MIESVDVHPQDVDEYLRAFEHDYLPGALGRGMELVGCWHTPRDFGEDVTVTAVFRVDSWAHWETIRNAGVGDPAMAGWVALRRLLIQRGSRRFHEAVDFSPLH